MWSLMIGLLSEQAINDVRMVKDPVAFYDPHHIQPNNITFTKEFIKALKTALACYQARLEEKRNKKELELSKAREKRENEERFKRKPEVQTSIYQKN